MTQPVSCFLPCRKGSERVPRKNIRPFAGIPHGLIEVKLKQLVKSRKIDTIYLSTNDDEILDFAQSLGEERLVLHKRAEELSSSQTSTDQLVAHALDLIGEGHILWTHVTSPFVSAELYDEIIAIYLQGLDEGFDSLMTTTEIHGFLWNEKGPVNYDRTIEKWPRTQTLAPLQEINSAAFLAPAVIYAEENDRIGRRPQLYTMERIDGMDIDWEPDFAMAEAILQAGLTQL